MGPTGDASRRSTSSLTVNEVNYDASATAQSHHHVTEHVRTPPRPVLGPRSVTEQELPSSRVHHRRPEHDRGGVRGAEREWTVFEQLMEDSGQLRTPDSNRTVKKRRSQRSGFHSTLSASAIHSRPDSVFEGSSIVQSPVQEAQTFPPEFVRSGTMQSNYTLDSESESESDSESESSTVEVPSLIRRLIPDIPVVYRNIIKCAVAYFLGSLFTYFTPLSRLSGSITSEGDMVPFPSGHMAATVVVYFNPAKTVGAMLEADLFCLYGFVWAAFIGMSSMSMFWAIDVQPGWEWVADVTAILWIAFGMGAVSWMKVWMAKPTFNTACSMTTIILFMVVVKEGDLQTLLQTAKIVFFGALSSNIVCYTLWPQKASTGLQNNITRALGSFATLLDLLMQTFLISDSEPVASQSHLQRAVSDHQASFTSLKKSLAESRGEWLLGGSEAAEAYEDAVGCMNRLAQHLNGLRSGTRLQAELAQAARDGKVILGKHTLDALQRNGLDGPATQRHVDSKDAINLQVAAHIFGELIDDMGPPLKALSASCTSTLHRLRKSFVKRRDAREGDIQKIFQLTEDIQRALFTFQSTSNQALMRVYRRSDLMVSESFKSAEESIPTSNSGSSSAEHDNPVPENELLLRSGADETVFLVYFFIFTLQEFARELTALTEVMCRIYEIERVATEQHWAKRLMRFFYFENMKEGLIGFPATTNMNRKSQRRPTLSKRFSTFFMPYSQRRQPIFPKVRPHAPNTVLTPGREQLSFWERVGQSIWRFNEKMKDGNVKFAVKAGIATALLGAPAFFDSTRPVFMKYRGEWALISFFIVISPTIGATNFLSLHRLIGTLYGAVTAVAVFSLFPENPVVLSIFGFFYAIPCFYYIVAKPQYASAGRFTLLTYNLTCLYCYNIRQRDVSVVDIAYYRSISVGAGVIYAVVVSRLWWPAEARRELSNALSAFCLNVGWLYTHLVAANSGILVRLHSPHVDIHDEARNAVNAIERDLTPYNGEGSPTETAQLLSVPASEKLNSSIQTFMAMELHLQIKLIELQDLLKNTQHEPRLKGPFPIAMYRSILTSLQTILDRLHSMRCVTTREEWFTSVKEDFVLPVNRERREMVGNVILYFSILASTFKLKTPLPPYLPPAERSRQRLVEAIRRLDIVKNRDVKGSQQLLFFAYALTMKGVIQELDFLGKTLQGAFGVIGQTVEEFEAMFRPDGRFDKLV